MNHLPSPRNLPRKDPRHYSIKSLTASGAMERSRNIAPMPKNPCMPMDADPEAPSLDTKTLPEFFPNQSLDGGSVANLGGNHAIKHGVTCGTEGNQVIVVLVHRDRAAASGTIGLQMVNLITTVLIRIAPCPLYISEYIAGIVRNALALPRFQGRDEFVECVFH